MSQKSLYDFETEQIDKMFDCKNYLLKNSKHEKVILESDTGVKMVRHIIYKPAVFPLKIRLKDSCGLRNDSCTVSIFATVTSMFSFGIICTRSKHE